MRLLKFAVALAFVCPLAVHAQTIATIAGGGPNNIPANTASIGGITGVAKDSNGDFYGVDDASGRVFKIDHATGTLTVVAGTGGPGFNGDGLLATDSELSGPHGIFIDASDNLFIGDADNSVVRMVPHADGSNYGIAMTAGHMYIVAGIPGALDFGGEGGPALSAKLTVPNGVFVDAAGNIFIADRFNHIVREVPNVDGVQYGITMTKFNIYTIAGTVPPGTPPVPSPGFSGDAGPATSAQLNDPFSVYVDAAGNVFIADRTNNRIRMVSNDGAAHFGLPITVANDIYTVAGLGTTGTLGDGGSALLAQLTHPMGVWLNSGNLFIADSENQAIREVPAAPGTSYGLTVLANNMYTIAGTLGTHGTTGNTGPAIAALLDNPDSVFVDAAGNVLIADTFGAAIREVAFADNNINLIAGNPGPFGPFFSFGGDGGPATNGVLQNPNAMSADALGNIYIADSLNDVIRRVDVGTGNISTVAGAPTNDGFGGDGGPAASGILNTPNGIFVDTHGNIFIADTANNRIREIPATNAAIPGVTGPIVAGNIYTIAGTGTAGSAGDTGAATAAQLNGPFAVVVDTAGNIFIADSGNHAIREIPATTHIPGIVGTLTVGNIYTVAGTLGSSGSTADGLLAISSKLNNPQAIYVDAQGNLFIADTNNNVVREVPAIGGQNFGITMLAQSIYTVAGNGTAGFSGDTGSATSAMLHGPTGVLVDPAGNLFIADGGVVVGFLTSTLNHVIREVPAVTANGMTTGDIYTVVGTHNVPGFNGDTPLPAGGTPGFGIQLDQPQGLAIGPANTLLIADTFNSRIRSVANLLSVPLPVPDVGLNHTSLAFAAQAVGTTSPSQSVTLTNTGNATLHITSIAIGGAGAASFQQMNTCTSPVAAAGTCIITVTFAPAANGSPTAAITITDDATGVAGTTQTITLSGVAATPTAILGGAGLSGGTLAFGSQTVSTSSAKKTVTLTNNSTVPLIIASIAIAGTNASDFTETDTCGSSLIAGATCNIDVVFKPAATGSSTATLTITDNASPTTQTVTLTGTGAAATTTLSLAAASGSLKQTVSAGGTATYMMQLSATGGTTPIRVTITCTGAPSLSTCTPPSTPVSVTPGTPADFTVTVKTTGSAAMLPVSPSSPNTRVPVTLRILTLLSALMVLVTLLANSLARMRGLAVRLRVVRLALSFCLLLMPICGAALLSGCGGGSSSSSTPPPPASTPTGTFTLTVTATATGATGSTPITLVVQ